MISIASDQRKCANINENSASSQMESSSDHCHHIDKHFAMSAERDARGNLMSWNYYCNIN